MAAGRIMLAWNNRIFSQYLNEENSYLTDQFSVEGLADQLYAITKNKEQALIRAKKGKEAMYPYSYALNVSKFKKAIKID